VTHADVSQVIRERIEGSVQLAGAALLLVLLVSVPLGMLAAAHTRDGRNRPSEVAITAVGSVVGAIPEYITATFLAFIFAVWLRLLPVAGASDWKALVLPTLAVSLRPIAVLTRVVRVETLNVLTSDYMRTARSKRLPTWQLYARHALPNVITGALTIGTLLFAGLVGGAVVVENVFARPGLGTALVAALLSRDYPVIQGIMLVLGATVVVANAITDVGLALLDPRSLTQRT
jgi:peptide/nickel transport system permease protein